MSIVTNYLDRLGIQYITTSGIPRFACPICGDSTKKNKRRGYVLNEHNPAKAYYYCHNNDSCNMFFSKFVKHIDSNIGNEYYMDIFANTINCDKNETFIDTGNLLRINTDNLQPLLFGNVYAKEYLLSRNVELGDFCYVSSKSELLIANNKTILNDDVDSIAISVSSNTEYLTGVILKTLGNKQNYNRLCYNDTAYGLHAIDNAKDIYVTEGEFDSLALNNCFALGGITKYKQFSNVSGNVILIPDSDLFINKNVRDAVINIAKNNLVTGIAIINNIAFNSSKDLNDIVKLGYSREYLQHTIAKSLYLPECIVQLCEVK